MKGRTWNTRFFVCFGAAVCLILGLCTAFSKTAVVPTAGWGLNFQTEGEPPIGNTSPSALAQYDAAFLGDTEDKVLYLTFDAGYENGYTSQILDVLGDHQAPAAFFLTGHYLETQPELVQRMADDGHTVGNHTWTHPDMTKISDKAAFAKELDQVAEKYREITGDTMQKYYRPPQGDYSEENLKLAQELGYKTVFWSLAYRDWENDNQPKPEDAIATVLGRTHDGAVVLLHATSKTNAAILDELLTRWEDEGYRFAPVSELFDEPEK